MSASLQAKNAWELAMACLLMFEFDADGLVAWQVAELCPVTYQQTSQAYKQNSWKSSWVYLCMRKA